MSRENAITLSKQLPHQNDHLLNIGTEAKKNGVHEFRLIHTGSEKESANKLFRSNSMGVKRAMQVKKVTKQQDRRASSERSASERAAEAGMKLELVSGKIPLGKKNQSQHVNVTFRPMD